MVEGIYAHTGDLAPLADIYKLKQAYKYGPNLRGLLPFRHVKLALLKMLQQLDVLLHLLPVLAC